MKTPFASKKSIHIPTIEPHVLKLLTTSASDSGLIYPIDQDTHSIDPRFSHMDLWDTFIHLNQKGDVCDLGFKLPDPAQQEAGFYMARSKHMPKLSSNDPLYSVIANLENQWRIKWLRDLMKYLTEDVLTDKDQTEFSAWELACDLQEHNPSLIPQKSWRCRGHDYTRIENELIELLLYAPYVIHDGYALGSRFGFTQRPARVGMTRARLFCCCREELV